MMLPAPVASAVVFLRLGVGSDNVLFYVGNNTLFTVELMV